MSVRTSIMRGLRGLLTLSGASLVRMLRYGPSEGIRSLQDTYFAVDPFSPKERRLAILGLKRIPEVPACDAFTWPETLQLDLRHVDVSGSTPITDLSSILGLAVQQQPEAALEFGTFYGSTTANLARNLPTTVIHTIDLPPDKAEASELTAGRPVDDLNLIESRQLGKAFRGTPLAARIVQHSGDTATYDYSVIPDKLSFFLIDGSHTYEYAKSDTLTAFRLAQAACTVVWHDCDADHLGVTRWLGELIDAGLPVKRIEGTVVAFLRIKAEDQRVQGLF